MGKVLVGRVKGEQGFSPEVNLSHVGDTLTISVTNESGTQTESIKTGEPKNPDWKATDTTDLAYIKNKPELGKVATSNSYADLDDKPTNLNQFTNGPGYITNADIPTTLSSFAGDETHRLVTDAEKTAWNDKADAASVPIVTDTYSATSSNAMSGKAVASALSTVDLTSKADAATTLAGYGITDAKITSGTITLGGSTITPLTSSSTLDATKVSGTLPTDTYTDTKAASSLTCTSAVYGSGSATTSVQTALTNLATGVSNAGGTKVYYQTGEPTATAGSIWIG